MESRLSGLRPQEASYLESRLSNAYKKAARNIAPRSRYAFLIFNSSVCHLGAAAVGGQYYQSVALREGDRAA